MDKCLDLIDWNGFAARKAQSESAGLLRGRGLAYFIEEAGVFNERMDVRFDPEGNVTILAGTHSHGQGHATTFAQLVSEWLGVPFESIRYVQGDTQKVAIGRGTYASRSIMAAAARSRSPPTRSSRRGASMAAFLMEAKPDDIEFGDGLFRVKATNRSMPHAGGGEGLLPPLGIPKELGVGLEGHGSSQRARQLSQRLPRLRGGDRSRHRPGERSCATRRSTTWAASSIPMIVEGQVHGALAQGIGQALLRASRLRPPDGPARLGQLHGLRHAACGRLSSRSTSIITMCPPRPIRSASRASARPAPQARRRPS